jgi:tetratricopeptide (TPR) repeat protein
MAKKTPKKKTAKKSKDAAGMDKSFAAAIRAVESAWDSDDAWDHLEEFAESLSRPEDVAKVYRSALEVSHTPELRDHLAERAVAFHEEWFGDDPALINEVLTQVIELDPEASWAFERLTEILTAAGLWDELFAAYDKALAAADSDSLRGRLLEEAANIARDIADQPDRALTYLMKLQTLDREDVQRLKVIERLLERRERWQDLIDLWRGQIEILGSAEARETWVRIAECYLQRLADPTRAFDVLGTLLNDAPGYDAGCEQLEHVLEHDKVSGQLRFDALDLLIANYEAAKRPDDVVAALVKAIDFAEPHERIPLHRRAGLKLGLLGKDVEAIEHYAKLLVIQPSDNEALRQLRILSVRSKRTDLRAAALVAAAEACEDNAFKVNHLVDAARIHADQLDDADGAIDLYQRVLGIEDNEPSVSLMVAQSLNELLAATGRSEMRLEVLVRLADLERTDAARRNVLGEAARLAQQLGDADRSLGLWNAVLGDHTDDVEAISAVVELLELNERWETLAGALSRRADSAVLPEQRRADLVRAAGIFESRLDAPDRAIETWQQVIEEFGPRADAIEALDRLLDAAGRFDELVALFKNATGGDYQRVEASMLRLGDICRSQLKKNDEALEYYVKALALDPRSERARKGIIALAKKKTLAPMAVMALVEAYRATEDWQALIEITEARLDVAADPAEQPRILREAASLAEHKIGEPATALELLCRAMPLDPNDAAAVDELLRLAEATGEWEGPTRALEQAAKNAAERSALKGQLLRRVGELCEDRLGDATGALAAFKEVMDLDSRDRGVLRAVIRVAAGVGQWRTAAVALVQLAVASARLDQRTVEVLEEKCDELAGWEELPAAVRLAIESRQDLKPDVVSELATRVAIWFRDRCQDLEQGKAAAELAVSSNPGNLETNILLADFQRRIEAPELVQTLHKIYDLDQYNLDPLFEAAERAETLAADDPGRRQAFVRLYEESARLWRLGAEARGEHSCGEAAGFAADKIAQMDLERDEWQSAVQVLLEAANLPFEPVKSRQMQRLAAESLVSNRQWAAAVDVYYKLLDRDKEDLDVITALGGLLEREQRLSDLLAVRTQELALSEDQDRRIELRLEIARLSGILEGSDRRLKVLEENLQEMPGHPESLDAAHRLLRERARYTDLVELFTRQAEALTERDENRRAARLWAEVARVAEENLQDVDLAISAHVKVVEIEATAAALDALARLHSKRGELGETAKWLEKRLEISEQSERVSTLLRLARARIQLDHLGRATTVLEQAFEESPRNAEVRRLLLDRYRHIEDYESLAMALSTAADHVSEEGTVLSYLREAAELFFHELGSPARAVPALRRCLELEPEDQEIKQMLADGLLADEQLDEAQALLEEILKGFGRRRSPQRAAIHLLLANVARAQGDADKAIEQLELATKMDKRNVAILKTLAELSREKEDLNSAERAYRSLLLLVRREQPAADEEVQIGPSEVLFELSWIASARGQDDKADELSESALEALSKNDDEAARIREKLLDREGYEQLVAMCESRLGYLDRPRKRARALSEMAEVLDEKLERHEEALEARLKALDEFAGSPVYHDAAEELATRLEQAERYESKVEDLLGQARRSADVQTRCELLLRLAGIAAWKREDLDQAWELFHQAEETGVREVDVWRLGSKLASARGDEAEQVRLLTNLSNMGQRDSEDETRADALYRLAEIQLLSEDTYDDGLEAFDQAFEEDANCERAGRVLRRTCESIEPDARLIVLYEKVARKSEDQEMLLDYLERAAAMPDATPGRIREAAELAEAREEQDRAEALMRRAVEVGENLADGMEPVGWAMLGLARRRGEAGDLAGAVKWIMEASEVVDPALLFTAGSQVADLACQPDGDLTLATKLYERLLEIDSSARAAWEPLAKLYLELGDVEGFERLVEESMYTIEDPPSRNVLRLLWAKLLLATDGREADAIDVLKNIQLEEPGHEESLALLSSHLEQNERFDELFELLNDQFLLVQERGNVEEIRAVALQLGQRLEGHDRDEAAEVYRKALAFGPNERDLLAALLGLLDAADDGPERVQLLERMLVSEVEERVPKLALQVADAYRDLDDADGELRALEQGFNRVPGDDELRERLEQNYEQRGDLHGLVGSWEQALDSLTDQKVKLRILNGIATICRDQLSDVAREVRALRQAVELEPDDLDLVTRLIDSLGRSGMRDEAIERAGEALSTVSSGIERLGLLMARGNLRMTAGDLDGSVTDLEEAFELDPKAVAPLLEESLKQRKQALAKQDDQEGERAVTMRLAELLESAERTDELRTLLDEWLTRFVGDVDAWNRLMTLETAAENWEGVIAAGKKLVVLVEGDEQIETVTTLAWACELLDQLDTARKALEFVYARNQDSKELREELKNIYEKSGADDKLAQLLTDELATVEDDAEKAGLLRRIGGVYQRAGDAAAAIAALEQSLELAPDDTETALAVVDVRIGEGELDQAAELLDKAIDGCKGRRSPQLAALQVRKARISRAQGERKDELGWLELAALSDRTNGQLALDAADLAEELEEWASALKALKNMTLMKGECPIPQAQAFFRLGRVTLATGDKKRAILYVKRAVKEDPEFEEAREFLADNEG